MWEGGTGRSSRRVVDARELLAHVASHANEEASARHAIRQQRAKAAAVAACAGKGSEKVRGRAGEQRRRPAAVAASARDRTRRHLHEVELLQTTAARSSDELTPLSPSCPSRLRLRQTACTTASDESGSPRSAARIACRWSEGQ